MLFYTLFLLAEFRESWGRVSPRYSTSPIKRHTQNSICQNLGNAILDLRLCCDVIMSTMASQITSLTIAYSTVYSGTDKRKYQSSASLAFVRGIHWAQRASSGENYSIWWRHHDCFALIHAILVIAAPADALEPTGANPAADTVLTIFIHFFSMYLSIPKTIHRMTSFEIANEIPRNIEWCWNDPGRYGQSLSIPIHTLKRERLHLTKFSPMAALEVVILQLILEVWRYPAKIKHKEIVTRIMADKVWSVDKVLLKWGWQRRYFYT